MKSFMSWHLLRYISRDCHTCMSVQSGICHANETYILLHIYDAWPAIYVRHALLSCHTNLDIYPVNKMAASAPWAWRLNHSLHDMHVMIFVLPPVIYVRHTVTSRDTNFGVYQASETAASAPWARHVSHALHDMHVMISWQLLLFVFVTQSLHAIPILVYIKLTKRPPAHHERGT